MTDPQALEAMLRKANTMLYRRGWPTGPDGRLWWIRQRPNGELTARPGSPEVFRHYPAASSAQVLYAAARAFEQSPMTPYSGAMFSEAGWMIRVSENDDDDLPTTSEVAVDVALREIHKRDDKTMVRVLSVVMGDGAEAALYHHRDTNEVRFTTERQDGLVVRALRIFAGLPEEGIE
jgi:hypothetical protein